MFIFFKKKCQKNMFYSNFISKSDQNCLFLVADDKEMSRLVCGCFSPTITRM